MKQAYTYAAVLEASERINWRVEDLIGGDKLRQIEARQMRENLRECLPRVSLGDQRGDVDVWMSRGEPDQIGAGIARSAEHSGPDERCLSHE